MMKNKIKKIYYILLTAQKIIKRNFVLNNFLREKKPIKINLGCGNNYQNGYINIDIRYTKATDLIASMRWCEKKLYKKCDEIYISHILEHFSHPGKDMREDKNSVIGFLKTLNLMLKPGGYIRVAVPNFKALAQLYFEKGYSLYPRLIGRICGEQNYKGNLHKCIFDEDFLKFCLSKSGFENFEKWNPLSLGLESDSSYDEIENIKTSLNIVAKKQL